MHEFVEWNVAVLRFVWLQLPAALFSSETVLPAYFPVRVKGIARRATAKLARLPISESLFVVCLDRGYSEVRSLDAYALRKLLRSKISGFLLSPWEKL